MRRIAVAPVWEWWLIWYFFLGGLAAGAYCIASLIDLVGTAQDRAMARVSYYLTFPLVLLCAVLLTLDLGQPTRFWHMLIQSETWRPMFKSWSPMSVGAWSLTVFGALALLSFVRVLTEDTPLRLGPLGRIAAAVHRGWLGRGFAVLGAAVGCLIASYTGVLLTASNQPVWSDTRLLGGLFLASAMATGTAVMLLLRCRSAAPAALRRLAQVNAYALLLELVLLMGFLLSLGSLATPLLRSHYGWMLLGITGLIGLVIPLAVRVAFRRAGTWSMVASCLCILLGGLEMRYSLLMAAQHLVIAGR